LLPTSNAKAPNGNWYHNKSTNANDAAAGQDSGTYETLSPILLSSTTEGVGYIDANGDSAYTAGTDSAYYLMNRFFIKSSGDIITNTTLYINQVTVSSSVPTLEIDNALRVCVVVDGTPYLFAPVTVNAGPTLTYRVAGSTADTTALAGTTRTRQLVLQQLRIPMMKLFLSRSTFTSKAKMPTANPLIFQAS
jgi:hypothetical protein